MRDSHWGGLRRYLRETQYAQDASALHGRDWDKVIVRSGCLAADSPIFLSVLAKFFAGRARPAAGYSSGFHRSTTPSLITVTEPCVDAVRPWQSNDKIFTRLPEGMSFYFDIL